jgi:rhamnogalacturonan endolyase
MRHKLVCHTLECKRFTERSSKGSHIGSGLGSANVTWNTSPSGSTALITVSTSTLTHYYASRGGENIIYMATYVTAEPSVGELRYIFRGNGSVLTGVPANSNIRNNTGAIESQDVFGYANGQTTSKYYGNDQAKDLTIRGVTGSGVGVFMAMETGRKVREVRSSVISSSRAVEIRRFTIT